MKLIRRGDHTCGVGIEPPSHDFIHDGISYNVFLNVHTNKISGIGWVDRQMMMFNIGTRKITELLKKNIDQ